MRGETTEEMLLKTQQMLLEMNKRLDDVLQDRNSDRPWSMDDACQYFGVSPNTIKLWRKEWTEGVHYWRLPGYKGEYRYNPELLKDWLENRGNERAHQMAIENWNSNRLCNQRTRKRAS